MKIAVVGGGITGLTTAFELIQKGHQVCVFEKEDYLGGLASGIKQGGWYIDRFYHHIFTTDKQILNLTEKLGLDHIWLWQKGDSPIYYQNQIYAFSSPLDLLKFSPLSFKDRLRTGLGIIFLKLMFDYSPFEKVRASVWLKKWMGRKSFKIIWQPLMLKKFGQLYGQVKMTWMWARIKKRSSLLGYPQGGFQVIIDQLARRIKQQRGEIFVNREIKNLKELQNFDKIIFTTASPIFEKVTREKLPDAASYLGTITILLQLKKNLTKGVYWLNINDNSLPFVALVEQTNFIDKKNYHNQHFVYLGTYLNSQSALFKQDKEKVFTNWLKYLSKINPDFRPSWVKKWWFFKEPFAQPVFKMGSKVDFNNFETGLENVYLGNMTHIYPWDRGVNFAVDLGKRLAKVIS